MGETRLYEALKQLNHLLWNMSHCFETLESFRAAAICWKVGLHFAIGSETGAI